ncbi:RusA family crossover junction endodeoxyribonuclease [Pandoraea sp. XJJ-1]|uniref:RusA family crossover junction endodeoxyribonuclease n=1 Tax=Pandoraea sp. XJJ-1 TaxID=3002643 RepID=UPI0022803B5B|nr:RusA family crossover junction endodeoxyribonuclease [Pandoraea sp. XJJ-1]WAL80970.1 RusA family crossover junction endodeoxyribonuclease [Pandoraea sp. XJJ-1]
MKSLSLELPMPPSANRIWRNGAGRNYRSAEYMRFIRAVSVAVVAAGAPTFGDKRLEVHIRLHPATRARQDIDNRVKACLDALTHAGVMDDDSQVDVLVVDRGPVVKGGKSIVRLAVFDPAAEAVEYLMRG